MCLVLAISVLCWRCQKIEGCTRPDAFNYNPDANVYEAPCVYRHQIVFWYDKNTAQKLASNEADSLTFYLNDLKAGVSYETLWPNAEEPDLCLENSTTGTRYEYFRSKSYVYSVKDQNDLERWRGEVTLEFDEVKVLELIW